MHHTDLSDDQRNVPGVPGHCPRPRPLVNGGFYYVVSESVWEKGGMMEARPRHEWALKAPVAMYYLACSSSTIGGGGGGGVVVVGSSSGL